MMKKSFVISCRGKNGEPELRTCEGYEYHVIETATGWHAIPVAGDGRTTWTVHQRTGGEFTVYAHKSKYSASWNVTEAVSGMTCTVKQHRARSEALTEVEARGTVIASLIPQYQPGGRYCEAAGYIRDERGEWTRIAVTA